MEVALRTGQPISEVRALPAHELQALMKVAEAYQHVR